jgi:hypothetical protein
MLVVGRTRATADRLKNRLTVPLGRVFEIQDDTPILGEDVCLDVNEPHMILICGKRGYGKSYTMGVLLEGLLSLPPATLANLSMVVIDAMGVFWTMQEPAPAVSGVGGCPMEARGFPVSVYFPQGLAAKYSPYRRFFHEGFQLYPSELELSDWLYLLDVNENQAQAAVLARVLRNLRALRGAYFAIEDMLELIRSDDAPDTVSEALVRKLEKAIDWGVFSDQGERVEDIVSPGRCIVFDLSGAGELPWNVRTLLTALLCRRLYSKRAFIRTNEEISRIYGEQVKMAFPLVWLFIDEAHLFAPSERTTPATAPLLEWVRQGRRPGLSLVLATQQPGALDRRLLSQCDTLVIQRLTAGQDSSAIGSKISEIHGAKSVAEYMRLLPKSPGYAIVLNDLTEDAVQVRIRPRLSWDGGGSAKLEDYPGTISDSQDD